MTECSYSKCKVLGSVLSVEVGERSHQSNWIRIDPNGFIFTLLCL